MVQKGESEKMPHKIAVIGAGAWGTTLSILLLENGHNVTIWAFEKEVSDDINKLRENKHFLPGFLLPASINATSNLKEACSNAELIIFVAPVQHLTEIIRKIGSLSPKTILLSASKGIEIKSLKRPSQILHEYFKQEIAVLSGPNLAREIAKGLPAASVVAAKNKKTAQKIQDILMSDRFRIYTQDDVAGVELGGALKNIIAIAAGITDGLNLGENARAGLMVRGIAEISRLAKALGASEKTFYGLSGIGDLMVTCGSNQSRNHRAGVAITQDKNPESSKEVAEGIPTCKAVYKLAIKNKIEMPITFEIYSVLFEGKDPYAAISNLLKRKAKSE